jgi:hypothetical protein
MFASHPDFEAINEKQRLLCLIKNPHLVLGLTPDLPLESVDFEAARKETEDNIMSALTEDLSGGRFADLINGSDFKVD